MQHWVRLDGTCHSDWFARVPAGVRPGSRLGLWLFLVIMNDLKISGESTLMWKLDDYSTISELVPVTFKKLYNLIEIAMFKTLVFALNKYFL